MGDKCKYNCKKGKIYMESIGSFVDCPDCRNIKKVLETTDNGDLSLYEKLRVPKAYKNYGVSGRELFNIQGISNFTSKSINELGNLLERINKDLYSGSVTSLSCYIHTPNIVDIKRFVYGAQKLAIEKCLGVTPFISLNTLNGLQKAIEYNLLEYSNGDVKVADFKNKSPEFIQAIEGYKLIQETNLSYYDFINTDLCFVEATANTTEKGFVALADLLGERAKKGLPTYVIGYWGTTNLNNGLRYLLIQGQAHLRLDLLVPFELKTKRGSNDEDAFTSRLVELSNTRSQVTAGLNLDKVFN